MEMADMAQQESKMDLTNQYNKLAFLTPTIVDLCDTLRESTECKKELKYYINHANKEAQKILAKHYKMYESYGTILSKENGNEMSTEDIYNITSKSYDFLLNKSPHEICCIAQIIREAEKSGLDYTAIEIPFTPL